MRCIVPLFACHSDGYVNGVAMYILVVTLHALCIQHLNLCFTLPHQCHTLLKLNTASEQFGYVSICTKLLRVGMGMGMVMIMVMVTVLLVLMIIATVRQLLCRLAYNALCLPHCPLLQ